MCPKFISFLFSKQQQKRNSLENALNNWCQPSYSNLYNLTPFCFSSLGNIKIKICGSIRNIWTFWKIKQKSVVLKWGEFLIMFFRLNSIFIHTVFVHRTINWIKCMTDRRCLKMIIYKMNIIMIYQTFSPCFTECLFKKQLNAS